MWLLHEASSSSASPGLSHGGMKKARKDTHDCDWEELLSAAQTGQVEFLEDALNRDPELVNHSNVGSNNQTLLMVAASHGRVRLIRYLVQHTDACVDSTDLFGNTALYYAAEKGLAKSMTLLLKAGADPNIKSSCGWTPLMVAACNNRLKALRTLLDHHQLALAASNAMTTTEEGGEDEDDEPAVPLDVDANNNMAKTALWLACERGRSAAVRLLLIRGAAQFNTPPDYEYGLTPRQVALRNGHHHCVDFIDWYERLEHGLVLHKARCIHQAAVAVSGEGAPVMMKEKSRSGCGPSCRSADSSSEEEADEEGDEGSVPSYLRRRVRGGYQLPAVHLVEGPGRRGGEGAKGERDDEDEERSGEQEMGAVAAYLVTHADQGLYDQLLKGLIGPAPPHH